MSPVSLSRTFFLTGICHYKDNDSEVFMKLILNPRDRRDIAGQSTKDWIVLHMTAGGSLTSADVTLDKADTINTHFIIDRDGTVQKRMEYSDWAYHTGKKDTSKRSIGIELVGWGALTKNDTKYFTWTGKEIPANEVTQVYPFNGVRYYHKLTDAQITALKEVIADIKLHNVIVKTTTHATLSKMRSDYPPDYQQLKEFL